MYWGRYCLTLSRKSPYSLEQLEMGNKMPDSGEAKYDETVHFFEVLHSGTVTGKTSKKMTYFRTHEAANALFEEIAAQDKYVWLSERANVLGHNDKWCFFRWSGKVCSNVNYPYPPTNRGHGYVAEGHIEVPKKSRKMPQRYIPLDPMWDEAQRVKRVISL